MKHVWHNRSENATFFRFSYDYTIFVNRLLLLYYSIIELPTVGTRTPFAEYARTEPRKKYIS